MVVAHIMHGPRGPLNPKCPCMSPNTNQCRFHYPENFNHVTLQGDDSYPQYRRRNNGRQVEVRKKILDNRWVVPYNPRLLMTFNRHINVEVCSNIKSVKYVFKYAYKSHDMTTVHIEPDGIEQINEINNFQDARWVSPPEAMWRIFGFSLSEIHPSVMMLAIHLPNQQQIRYNEKENLAEVTDKETSHRSMLLAFFEKNRENEHAR
jgi:hypothetical protein